VRCMSFALTTAQIQARTKTVTRRLGWATLKPGTLLQPVVKGQGLKKGETVQRIGGPIRVVSVSRERLNRLYHDAYGPVETVREGFPGMTGQAFVAMFCTHNRTAHPMDYVTRIEFVYEESYAADAAAV